MEDVLRSLRWLIVVAALAAAAYVAQRVRHRVRPMEVGALEGSEVRVGRVPVPPESPAEPVAMVARMEGSHASPIATRPATNGTSDGPGTRAAAPRAPRLVELPPVELPPRRRLSGAALAAIAGILGVAAIALGVTALVTSLDSDGESAAEAASPDSAQTISLLSKPSTQRVPIAGSGGRIILAISSEGRGVLVLDGLGLAPAGKDYQAWVIRPKAKAPASAGVFSGVETIVPLSVAVRPGSLVAITIERAGGVPTPTQTPKLVAQAAGA